MGLSYTHTVSPVLIDLGCASRYAGKVRPKNMEKPRTKRFLEEFKSTSCRFDRPTAVIIPETATHWSCHYGANASVSAFNPGVTHQTECRTFHQGWGPAGRRTEPWTSPQPPTETWCLLHTAPRADCQPAHKHKHLSCDLMPEKSSLRSHVLISVFLLDG